MAVQYILPPTVIQSPTVTDLVNRASILLQTPSFALSESCTTSGKTSTTVCNDKCSDIEFTTEQHISMAEAAVAMMSTALAFSEVTTLLVNSGVSHVDLPLTRVVGVVTFVSSALESICRALSDILRAPFLVKIVSGAAAKTVVSAAMAAEAKADSLVKDATLLANVTSEQIERSFEDDKVPVSNSSADRQMQFFSEEDVGDHRNISRETSSQTLSGLDGARHSKSGILERFGYILEDIVGYGKFSVIKAAESKIHNCKVAVKIVTKSEVPQLYQDKFLPREIQVSQILNHKNIIKFFQVIETNHCVYFVMEYAERGSIRDVIRKENVNENRARRWFGQLVEAVNYCHKLGITHRDIKCENVLLDAEDNIKLTEFYFARLQEASTRETSLSCTFCGTEDYAAPEVLRHIPYDPTLSDVWSMGVVLFVIIYGKLPFGPVDMDLLRQTSNYNVSFPKEPEVTTRCKQLISQMLSPERSRIDVEAITRDPWLQTPENSAATEHSMVGDDEINRQLTEVSSDGRKHISRFKSVMKSLAKTKAVRVVSKSVNDMEGKLMQWKGSFKNHLLTK